MFEVVKAKNGVDTLLINSRYVYSKYDPKKDAHTFIEQRFDSSKERFLLVGLGLGYHLDSLLKLAEEREIYVLLCEEEELNICSEIERFTDIITVHFVTITELENIIFDDTLQVIIPYSILNSLDFKHPVRETFEQYKLNEMSFVQYDQKLHDNLHSNLELKDPTIKAFQDVLKGPAILVSSGPSIDATIEIIKSLKGKVFILAVGSALRILKTHQIEPDAIVWSDAKQVGLWHLHNIEYNGPLFYLATASNEVVATYKGNRFMMFQKGYEQSEQLAEHLEIPTFEVGGSVATAAFSFLNYFGATEIVLCGQDLGFKEGKTHSAHTFSGVTVNKDFVYREIPSNDGETVKVSKSLYSYFKWFDKHVPLSTAVVYNTAKSGAKIAGTLLLEPSAFYEKYKHLPTQNFSTLFEVE